jgi:tRNA dimethylallyltransferase
MTLPPLLIVGGPTATGKTVLSIALASALGGEIINADSRQIYRGMDIGTAKPTPAEQALVPHHLLDLVDPDTPFTLALYVNLARQAIADCAARHRLPVLVGGTGLYLRAVAEGYVVPEVPPNLPLRAQLADEAAEHGPGRLVDRLRDLDPEAAATIDSRNLRRVIRAIEVSEALGSPFSLLQRKAPAYDCHLLLLEGKREVLFARADARLETMLQAGFETEVRTLLGAGYGLDLPAFSALGYRELGQAVLGCTSREEAVASTRASTRAFIKRQDTWFRTERSACRLRIENEGVGEAALRSTGAWLDARR